MLATAARSRVSRGSWSPGLPRTRVTALRTALTSDEVRKRLAADGAEPTPSTPEEHALLIEQEHAKWTRLVNQIGFKPE